jgi:hypothetical protein
MTLEPGDIVCTTSGTWLSRAIRWFSRGRVSHTGIGTRSDTITEALTRVVRRLFRATYHGSTLTVYRPLDLPPETVTAIAAKAETYVGRSYGYGKILAHALDRALGGAYLFRRVAGLNNYPICSWVVAHAYSSQNLTFGVAPGAASPADIDRFCREHPAKYLTLWPLSRWPG